MAALGKLASKVSFVGGVVWVCLSIRDLSDGNATQQDVGMLVGSILGIAAGCLSFCVAAPVIVTGLSIASVAVTFFSYALPDTGDETKVSNY